MGALEHARYRLRAFLDELEHIQEGEFPYRHSKDALQQLASLSKVKLTRLEGLGPASDPDVVQLECRLALRYLFIYLPVLGFILRSTNLRNAFEVFGPLLRLARKVLEPDVPPDQRTTKLVLSSEWDYSPFTYPEIKELPGFVLIGLPAPESGNPLLIPLAGHELGHPIWIKRKFGTALQGPFTTTLAEKIASRWADYVETFRPAASITPADLTTDLFVLATWERALEWAIRQGEETFCDFVGLRIFGRSYLEAFAYLLTPTAGLGRSAYYPATTTRVRNLVTAAKAYGVPVPDSYEQMFDDSASAIQDAAGAFLRDVADTGLQSMVSVLVEEANDAIVQAALEKPAEAEVARILGRFKHVVPVEDAKSLIDIVNAAWRVYHDSSFWEDLPQVSKRKEQVLRELTLKNIEVFEIEQIVKGAQ